MLSSSTSAAAAGAEGSKSHKTATMHTTVTAICACGEVEVDVSLEKVLFSSICHCKACSRMRSSSLGVHIVGLPRESVAVRKGEEHIREGRVRGNRMTQHFCGECGTGMWQNPSGEDGFRAVFPANFVLQGDATGDNPNGPDRDSPDCTLPDELLPTMHINYENRRFDTSLADALPKRREFGGSEFVNSDGTPVANEGDPPKKV
jgi:hypothetical protein